MSESAPKVAMVLAAGLGMRMRPITETLPKPLVRIAGKALLDWGLDSLAEAGVTKAVVNVHYLARPDRRPCRDTPRAGGDHFGRARRPAQFGRRHRQGAAAIWARSLSSSSTPIHSGSTAEGPICAGSPLNGTRRGWIFCSCSATSATRPATAAGRIFCSPPMAGSSRAAGDPAGLIYAGAAIVHPRIFAGAAAARALAQPLFRRGDRGRTAVRHAALRELDHRRDT